MLSEPDHLSCLNEGLDLTLRKVMVPSATAFVFYAGVEQQSRVAFIQNTDFRTTVSNGVVSHLAGVIMIQRQRRDYALAVVAHL